MRSLVTGASRGIGLEFVRQLLARGDIVAAVARNPKESKALVEHGEKLRLHEADVGDDASTNGLAKSVAPGSIDLVVNAAGVLGKSGGVAELDMADALRTFDVNALGPLRVMKALRDRFEKGARLV